MTCLMDCCHSGTVLDLPYRFIADGDHVRFFFIVISPGSIYRRFSLMFFILLPCRYRLQWKEMKDSTLMIGWMSLKV
jgi:hypothetical protein